MEVLLCAWSSLVMSSRSKETPLEQRENLILLMQSACVQELISCLKEDAVSDVICEFLHCFWIENPRLIKLVHFQTYSLDLLPVTVAKIDSLICAWDFLAELVRHGSFEQRRFALFLTGHLAYKYPTQRLLNESRDSLQYIEEHLHQEPWLEQVYELLTRAFPQLCGKVKELRKKKTQSVFSYARAQAK
jgi:hypothetical protein